MMGKVQKPSNSECDTPSSEPFRFYKLTAPGITGMGHNFCVTFIVLGYEGALESARLSEAY
jgi:hypothetical protein